MEYFNQDIKNYICNTYVQSFIMLSQPITREDADKLLGLGSVCMYRQRFFESSHVGQPSCRTDPSHIIDSYKPAMIDVQYVCLKYAFIVGTILCKL